MRSQISSRRPARAATPPPSSPVRLPRCLESRAAEPGRAMPELGWIELRAFVSREAKAHPVLRGQPAVYCHRLTSRLTRAEKGRSATFGGARLSDYASGQPLLASVRYLA